MGTLAIETRGLSKTYGNRWSGVRRALTDVHLSLAPGCALGLVGPNGAGKTTFIKVLLSVTRPTSGTVRVLGGEPTEVRVRARIGYLPERLHLNGQATPLQVLASIARLKGVSSRNEEELLLERVGLLTERNERVGRFSKGMRQRLGLAAALVGRPELLVLDEPTDGVDPLGRVAIRELLLAERNRGTTLVLNSHLLSETERICDEVAILSQGRLVHRGALNPGHTTPTYRLRFAEPVSPSLCLQMGLRPGPSPAELDIQAEEPAALNECIDALRARGLLLVELKAATQDLESLLVHATAKPSTPAGEA